MSGRSRGVSGMCVRTDPPATTAAAAAGVILSGRGKAPVPSSSAPPCAHHFVHCVLTATKAQQLLQGLQASGDEGQQLSAVIEMCQVSAHTISLLHV